MTLGLSRGVRATQCSHSNAWSALQSCSLSAEAGRGLRSSHRSSAASSSLSSDQPGWRKSCGRCFVTGSLPKRLSCTSLPSAHALMNFLSCTFKHGVTGDWGVAQSCRHVTAVCFLDCYLTQFHNTYMDLEHRHSSNCDMMCCCSLTGWNLVGFLAKTSRLLCRLSC